MNHIFLFLYLHSVIRLWTGCSDLLCEADDVSPWKNCCRISSNRARSLSDREVGCSHRYDIETSQLNVKLLHFSSERFFDLQLPTHGLFPIGSYIFRSLQFVISLLFTKGLIVLQTAYSGYNEAHYLKSCGT